MDPNEAPACERGPGLPTTLQVPDSIPYLHRTCLSDVFGNVNVRNLNLQTCIDLSPSLRRACVCVFACSVFFAEQSTTPQEFACLRCAPCLPQVLGRVRLERILLARNGECNVRLLALIAQKGRHGALEARVSQVMRRVRQRASSREQTCRPEPSLHPWQPQLDGSLHRLVVAQLVERVVPLEANAGRTRNHRR